jgi:hypothetical protein
LKFCLPACRYLSTAKYTNKIAIFWDIAQCSLYEPTWLGHLLSRWFLTRLIFGPEDGGDTFLRNVGSYTDYTVVYQGRCNFYNYHCEILKILYTKKGCIFMFSPSLFPVASTVGHKASVKRFVSLQFHNPKTVGRAPWTGDQPAQGRYLHKHKINTDRHPCLEWDSNP